MIDILKDVSTLSTISEKTLTKFIKKINYSICDAVLESSLNNTIDETPVEINIGIGILYIKQINNEIKYHFEPTEALRKAVTQTIENKENILSDVLVESLIKKFNDVYKDLCE